MVWLAIVAAPAVAVNAAEPLPVGLQAEPSLLLTLGRLVLGAAGIFLLTAGGRARHVTATVLFLVVGLGVGWGTLASSSIPAALGVALLLTAVGLAVTLRLPRVGWAAAASWPLGVGVIALLLSQGHLRQPRTLLLVLAVLSAAGGALLPRHAPLLVAPALGTVLVGLAWPGGHVFAPLVVVFAAGLTWQLLAFLWLWPRPRQPLPPWRERRREADRLLVRHVTGAALAALCVVVLVAVAAPALVPATAVAEERLERARASGLLDRPGLLLMAEDTFYLYGQPIPMALVGGSSLVSRMAFPVTGRAPARQLHELRAVKDAGEVAAIRRAQTITASAFAAVAPLIRPGVTEAFLEERILEAFRAGGATGVAFKSVVGSGTNTLLPHYTASRATLDEGLVVIDIGCMVDGYASDMTRTFVVRGEPTEGERELLGIVAAAKRAAESACRAGVTMRELNIAAKTVIEEAGLIDYWVHGVGHHVGISVHDPGRRRLEAGHVITIEPGVYVPAGADTDERYHSLGARIEDTYLVTADGCERLATCPDLPEGLAPAASELPSSPREERVGAMDDSEGRDSAPGQESNDNGRAPP